MKLKEARAEKERKEAEANGLADAQNALDVMSEETKELVETPSADTPSKDTPVEHSDILLNRQPSALSISKPLSSFAKFAKKLSINRKPTNNLGRENSFQNIKSLIK